MHVYMYIHVHVYIYIYTCSYTLFTYLFYALLALHTHPLYCQAELPGSAPVFKEGFVMKKNIMEAPHKKGGQSSEP